MSGFFAVLVVAAFGCGDEVAPLDASIDAAVEAGDGAAGDADGSPPSSEGVDLRPCPEGWRELAAGADVVCEPWPESGPAECPVGEAHFPGEPGCAPLGRPCPSGVFADDALDTSIFVDSAAAPGGDGSRATPLSTVSEALARASDGDVIELGRGAHGTDGVVLGSGLTLRGACASETRIEASPGTSLPVALEDATLSDVTVAGEAFAEACVQADSADDAEVVIAAVHIDCGGRAGIAEGLDVTGNARVSRVRVARAAHGVSLFSLGSIVLDQVVVEDVGGGILGLGFFGALSYRGVHVTGSDQLGLVTGGADAPLVIEGTVIDGVTGAGMVVSGARQVTISDIVVRDVSPDDAGIDGFGLVVVSADSAAISRVRFQRVHDFGLLAHSDPVLTADHVLVEDVAEECDPGACTAAEGGSGIVATGGSSVTVSDFAVRRVALCGFHLDRMSSIDASDGEVAESAIGACVGSEDYDLTRLMDGIRYRDNRVNLDASALPTPTFDAMPLDM